MGTARKLGSQAWWSQPDGTATDAADGTFFADPLPQELMQGGSEHSRPADRWLLMLMQRSLLLTCAFLFAGGAAQAQAPPSPTQPPPSSSSPNRGTTGCAPTEANPHQGSISPQGNTAGQGNAPLSDKLAKSDGVLCPPSNVDPEMRAPAPNVGSTPVIPPPGSPGGDQTVRPK